MSWNVSFVKPLLKNGTLKKSFVELCLIFILFAFVIGTPGSILPLNVPKYSFAVTIPTANFAVISLVTASVGIAMEGGSARTDIKSNGVRTNFGGYLLG